MADTQSPPGPPSPPETQSSMFSRRSRRQLSLFFAGASIVWITSVMTRRAIVHKLRSTIPKFYQPSNQAIEVQPGGEAIQALGIASMYVLSIGATAAAGLLWAFDISNFDELRYGLRKGMGVDPDMKDGDADEELEELIASVLARKELRMFGGKDFKDKVRKEFEKEKEEEGSAEHARKANSTS